jgi:hypothetical protein
MRVKVEQLGQGLHPNEVVVGVRTNAGVERLVVPRRSVRADTIEIGFPINGEDNRYLVELPRETQSGTWRVWVSKDLVQES